MYEMAAHRPAFKAFVSFLICSFVCVCVCFVYSYHYISIFEVTEMLFNTSFNSLIILIISTL